MLKRIDSIPLSDLATVGSVSERENMSLGTEGQTSLLIKGNNKSVLDFIGPNLEGKVRCIYIDPPYNNMESYEHYNDSDSHEVWLGKLTNHVAQLNKLLTQDGSLWVSIDDRQVHYLKVELDRILGRESFVSTIIWQHRKTRENRKTFSNNHEYILVYARNAKLFKKGRNQLPYNEEAKSRFKNPDNDPRGPWQSISLNVQAGHATKSQYHEIVAPNGIKHNPPSGRCWMYTSQRVQELIADNRIWFGREGAGVPRLKRFLCEMNNGLTPHTLWSADEVGTTDSAKKEIKRLFPDEAVFDTPKPIELISRVLNIAADPGDIVLDSFLGSGTTAAAALQSGMRFIGIEQGDHIVSLCHHRLKPLVVKHKATVRFYEISDE